MSLKASEPRQPRQRVPRVLGTTVDNASPEPDSLDTVLGGRIWTAVDGRKLLS